MVVPAGVEATDEWVWLRLGLMDLIANELRDGGLTTTPSETTVGLINAKRLDADKIGPNRTIVPNISGLLGGIALWERTEGAAISHAESPLPSRT